MGENLAHKKSGFEDLALWALSIIWNEFTRRVIPPTRTPLRGDQDIRRPLPSSAWTPRTGPIRTGRKGIAGPSPGSRCSTPSADKTGIRPPDDPTWGTV